LFAADHRIMEMKKLMIKIEQNSEISSEVLGKQEVTLATL